MIEQATALLEKFGPNIVLVGYIVYTHWRVSTKNESEKASLIKRVEALEIYQKGEMADLIKQCTKALDEHTRVSNEQSKLMERMMSSLALERRALNG